MFASYYCITESKFKAIVADKLSYIQNGDKSEVARRASWIAGEMRLYVDSRNTDERIGSQARPLICRLEEKLSLGSQVILQNVETLLVNTGLRLEFSLGREGTVLVLSVCACATLSLRTSIANQSMVYSIRAKLSKHRPRLRMSKVEPKILTTLTVTITSLFGTWRQQNPIPT